jgi:hypothetical protein
MTYRNKNYLISIEEGFDYPKLENRVNEEMNLLNEFGFVSLLSRHDSRNMHYQLVMKEGNAGEKKLVNKLKEYCKEKDIEKAVISELIRRYEGSREDR